MTALFIIISCILAMGWWADRTTLSAVLKRTEDDVVYAKSSERLMKGMLGDSQAELRRYKHKRDERGRWRKG